jgi:plasmid stability protein
MPAIQIRDVPAEVITALKRRAARNERSLEGELRFLLAAIAREEPSAVPLPPLQLKLAPAPSSATATWSREEIYGDDGR